MSTAQSHRSGLFGGGLPASRKTGGAARHSGKLFRRPSRYTPAGKAADRIRAGREAPGIAGPRRSLFFF